MAQSRRFRRQPGEPVTWLIANARNRSIDRLHTSRKRRNMDSIDAATDIADSAAGADAALESIQEHKITRLPRRPRIA